ncbi:protein-arginine deiminase domain-containing protein [Streptomyces sp. NBC_00286]
MSYIDDWYTYHLGQGEVHCGTNTLRDTSAAWWHRP